MNGQRGIVSVVLLLCGMVPLVSATAWASSSISSSVNAFALNVYGRLDPRGGNVFFSPLSAATALAMTYAGAHGQTAEQMAKVLCLTEKPPAVHYAFGALLSELNAASTPACTLMTANALWAHVGARFLEEYVKAVASRYDATLKELDFASAPEQASETINRWVADRTQNTVTRLVPPGTIDSQTRMVLTDAVYFKGAWEESFPPEFTQDAPFTLASGEKTIVPMMHRTGNFRHAAADGVQVLELSYETGALSMVVLLPDQPDGLARLEQSLTTETLSRWTAGLKPTQMAVYIPRFKSSSDYRLDDVLKALGMVDAFSPMKADFEAMTGRKDLFIGAVFHSCFVDVNEEGTEAAGASGVVIKLKSGAAKVVPVFRADHPFVYVIRHVPSNCILFLGRMARPQPSQTIQK